VCEKERVFRRLREKRMSKKIEGRKKKKKKKKKRQLLM
jgi:ribosomal protein S21